MSGGERPAPTWLALALASILEWGIMMEKIAVAQVRRVAELAKAARDARDQMLVHVSESGLGEPKVARGLHDPAAAFGFDPLPPDHPTRLALRDAIAALPPDAQYELRALVLIGRGDFGAKEWEHAVAQASGAPDDPVEFLTGRSNLHEELGKGLFELKLA
jgi:Protein of unknown function (DUF3775)